MSYAVSQRSREISIRMALGASTGAILRRIVGQGLMLAGAGAVIGIGAAFALGRVIQGQLFGVPLLDPFTIVAVVVGAHGQCRRRDVPARPAARPGSTRRARCADRGSQPEPRYVRQSRRILLES